MLSEELTPQETGSKEIETTLLGRVAVRRIFPAAFFVFEPVSVLLPVRYGGAFAKQVYEALQALHIYSRPHKNYKVCTQITYRCEEAGRGS